MRVLPIQFIILLIVVCLPEQLADQAAHELLAKQGPLATQPSSASPLAFPLKYVLSLMLSHIVLVLVVWMRTRSAIRRLYATSEASAAITHQTDRLFFWARWLTIVLTGVHLFATPVGDYVVQQFSYLPLFKSLLVPELLFSLPAVLAWLGIWAAAYYVELAVRERSLPYRLAQQLPVHDMPSLWHFFALQARHNFFPALFLLAGSLVSLVAQGILETWLPAWKDSHAVQAIASMVGLAGLLLILPFLLVRIWSTRPLRGALRERLDKVAATYRLRFRNILLWRTHNLTINAAILGWLPFARYFLLSDSLLESFDDRQLEAVFAHEVGHGVHRHLHWFLAVGLGITALVMGTPILAVHYLPFLSANPETAQLVLSAVVLLVAGGLSVPFISPRFEHQADWFASRHMARVLAHSTASPPPDMAASASTPPASATPMSPPLQGLTAAEAVTLQQYMAGSYPHATVSANESLPFAARAGDGNAHPPHVTDNYAIHGAEIFISALQNIVDATHRDRRRRGFLHPSIDDRIRLLRLLAVSPEVRQRFDRAMRRTRYYIVALVLIGVASCVLAGMVVLQEEAAASAATQAGATMPSENTTAQQHP